MAAHGFYGYSNELFRSEAINGHKYARYVAERLQKCQIDCVVPDLTFADTKDDIANYRNEQDVILTSRTGCIEVKSRRLIFRNDPASYPHRTAFVDTVSGWDSKDPKPLAVVLVSQQTRGLLVIPVSTQDSWTKVRSFDRVRSINETWYQVDRNFLRTFNELVEWLGGSCIPQE